MGKNHYVLDIKAVVENYTHEFTEEEAIDVKLKIKSLFQNCERKMKEEDLFLDVIYDMVAEVDRVMYSFWKEIVYPAYKLDESSRPSEEQFQLYISRSRCIYEIINCALESIEKPTQKYAPFYFHMIEIAETLLVAKGYEIKQTILKKYKAVPVCELTKGQRTIVELDLEKYRKMYQRLSCVPQKVTQNATKKKVVTPVSSGTKPSKSSVDVNKVVLAATAGYVAGKTINGQSGKKSETRSNEYKERIKETQQRARDNQVYATYSKSNRCCATCQFFWGTREVDERTKKVTVRNSVLNQPGKCKKSCTSNNKPGSSCSMWKGI